MKRYLFLATFLICVTVLHARGQREDGGFSYEGIRALEIEARSFAVDITAGTGRYVTMTVENYPDDHTVLHTVAGTRVRVRVEQDRSLFPLSHRGRLVFRVPYGTEIDVETLTGSVSIAGVAASGLRVKTSTGGIRLQEIDADVHARSNTGSIEVSRSRGRFDVGTTTGSIACSDLRGLVTASSSTGSHGYESVLGDIDARSTTGRIELTRTGGAVHLRTSTGNQRGVGVTLTGDSSFQASTGSIHMDVTNPLDRLQFDLTSTTGSLEVGRERSQRRLFLSGTDIVVTGTTSTGSQRFF